MPSAHPLWDPILSFSHTFSHTFSPKSHRSMPTPNGCTPPPMGNPGSATADIRYVSKQRSDFYLVEVPANDNRIVYVIRFEFVSDVEQMSKYSTAGITLFLNGCHPGTSQTCKQYFFF